MTPSLTLAVALALAADPHSFLALYRDVASGAQPTSRYQPASALRSDGGKLNLIRRGFAVRITTYTY